MFVRAKKSGPYQYLQVVENRREGTKVVQRVVAPLGRVGRLNASRRYIVCLNPKGARKDGADREAILDSLKEQLKRGAQSLVGNRGFRRYFKNEKGAFSIDEYSATESGNQ
jgi:hypothetical protein